MRIWTKTARLLFIMSCVACGLGGLPEDPAPRTRRKGYRPRMTACKKSSQLTGCLKCRHRMFLLIQNMGDRQVAMCYHTCPAGYYRDRSSGLSVDKCTKCKIANCKTCFTHNYCTTCSPGFYLHGGKCVESCPDGLNPNHHEQKCQKNVDCKVSAWSSWTACVPKRPKQKSPCKRGARKRARTVLQLPTSGGKSCPRLKSSKKCKTPEDKCQPFDKLWRKENKRKRKKVKGRGRKKPRRKATRPVSNNTAFGRDRDQVSDTT